VRDWLTVYVKHNNNTLIVLLEVETAFQLDDIEIKYFEKSTNSNNIIITSANESLSLALVATMEPS